MQSTHQPPGDAPTAVLVSGMPGAGSGALTGVLRQLAGVASATDPGRPTATDPVAELNELVLARFGSWWAGWDAIDPHALEGAVRLVTRARRVLRDAAQDAEVLVLDDPRMARLLPLWTRALEQEGFRWVNVLAVPQPRALVRTLGRAGLNRRGAVLSWLAHTLDAELYTRRHSRVVVSLDDFSRDRRTQLERVAASLEVPWPRPLESITDAVEGAGERSRSPEHPVAGGRGAVATVAPVHEILRQWAERQPTPEEEATLDEWRRALEPVRRHRSPTALVASERQEIIVDMHERGLKPGRLAGAAAWRHIFSEGYNLEAGAAWSWLLREREALHATPPGTARPGTTGHDRPEVGRAVRRVAGRLRRGVTGKVRRRGRGTASEGRD